MSTSDYRITQRRPLACQECTKRKRKCDKEVPCGRCRRLKLECTRETVRLRNLSTKHSDEIAFLQSLKDDIVAGERLDPAIVQRIDDRIAHLEFGNGRPNSQVHLKPNPDDTRSSEELTGIVGASTDSSFVIEQKDADASILNALEYMAWGRSSSGCYPHRTCACAHNRGLHTASSFVSSDSSLLANLPRPAEARRLVEFHLRHIAWHHNCLHSTNFLEQCEGFWETGKLEHPHWLALYLSVLSSTVYCVQNSRKFSSQLGIDLGFLSSHQLFRDMLKLLYSEDFLGNASLYSVQAIVISTEVAHNLGFSQLNAILFGAAIRIGQCLGLHKIASRNVTNVNNHEQWIELVDLEVGKRVWCQMMIQDLFAIPFNDSHGIIPSHCSTDLPMNCDDDLIPRDTNIPTISSYVRVLAGLAGLMPELSDGLGPVSNRKPLQQQYDHVLRMDQKTREMVRQIPSFLLREDVMEQSRIPWLSIARRSLAITAAEKIIMIHRSHLWRAFQSPKYAYTRRTCVAAAMTILREHEAIAQSDDLSIWTHTAFCITAAVILSFEVAYRISTHDHGIEMYRGAIQAARERLVVRSEDVLASRGVTLIDAISLEEAAFVDATSSDSPKDINLPRVIEKFFAAKRFETQQASSAILETLPFDIISQQSDQYADDLLPLPTMNEFDEWYNNTFNEGQQYG